MPPKRLRHGFAKPRRGVDLASDLMWQPGPTARASRVFVLRKVGCTMTQYDQENSTSILGAELALQCFFDGLFKLLPRQCLSTCALLKTRYTVYEIGSSIPRRESLQWARKSYLWTDDHPPYRQFTSTYHLFDHSTYGHTSLP